MLTDLKAAEVEVEVVLMAAAETAAAVASTAAIFSSNYGYCYQEVSIRQKGIDAAHCSNSSGGNSNGTQHTNPARAASDTGSLTSSLWFKIVFIYLPSSSLYSR
jgi:hypothetical protein